MNRYSALTRAFVISLGLAFVPAPAVRRGAPSPANINQQESSAMSDLKVGFPIERGISGGETHTYQISVDAGHFARIALDQREADYVVRLFGPGGSVLEESDGRWHGLEPVSFVAPLSGTYRIEVSLPLKKSYSTIYSIRLEDLRQARPEDQVRIAAERASSAGKRLLSRPTAESLAKAVPHYEETLRLWRVVGDALAEGQTLNTLGYLHRAMFQIEKSLDYYSQALALRLASGDRYGESETLHNLAATYSLKGDRQKAVEYYDRALQLRQLIGDLPGEAITRSNLGSVYFSIGEVERAIEHLVPALSIWRKLGDPQGEAQTLINLGAAYGLRGERQTAIESFRSAVELSRSSLALQPEAYALVNLGKTYDELGAQTTALEHFDQALPLFRKIGDRRGEAAVLNNMAMAHYALDRKPASLMLLQQALELFIRIGDRQHEMYTLANIGQVHLALGELAKAVDHATRSLSLADSLNYPRAKANALNNLGMTYYSEGDKSRALGHLEKALPLWEQAQYLEGKLTTLSNLARIERELERLAEARAHVEDALEIVESLRVKVSSPELRASYFASKWDYYAFQIDLLMQLHRSRPSDGFHAAALQASERARARSLLDTLTEASAHIREGVDPDLLLQKKALQQQLNVKAHRLSLLLSSQYTPEQELEARRGMDPLLRELREVEDRIRTSSPRYAALTQPKPSSLEEIQGLLDEQTLLLEYALGDKRSYLWAVTPRQVEVFELPARTRIEEVARRFHQLLAANGRNSLGDAPARDRKDAAITLTRLLLDPAKRLLARKRLLIVGEGALQYVPFAALPEPLLDGVNANIPLVRNHEIVTLPSASTLSILRRELAGRCIAPMAVAVLADPVFHGADARLPRGIATEVREIRDEKANPAELGPGVLRSARESGMTTAGGRLRRLLFSRSEAKAILSLVPPSQAFRALDFDASRSTAMSPELGRYRIVHFSTHGFLNSVTPELSGIVLSLVDRQGLTQDGFLRLHDIYNLRLPVELVVLSSCQTGLGKDIRGEGLVGLTRGFLYAGAARVVVSLWQIDDEATAELMKHFYGAMLGKSHLSPAAALAAAQRAVMRQGRWSSPYYWAGFILQGEWR